VRQRIFYAAKVNVFENIFSSNLSDIINYHIPEAILESKPIKLRKMNWSFTDVKKIKQNNQEYIIGNITRSQYKDQRIKVEKRTKMIKPEYEIADTLFFVYYPSGEILIHEVNNSLVSGDQLRKIFEKLLEQNPYVGEVKIFPIIDKRNIREELLKFKKLTYLNFYLIRPNPGKKEFDLYQQIIEENNLRELRMEMSNKKEGIRISKNKDEFNHSIEIALQLTEKGYGKVRAKGEGDAREEKIFSSEKNVRSLRIAKVDEEERLISRLIEFILSILSIKR